MCLLCCCGVAVQRRPADSVAVALQVPLYERGYEKDPAKVAAEAVKVAQRDGRDVVLVDTAGRMQVGAGVRVQSWSGDGGLVWQT